MTAPFEYDGKPACGRRLKTCRKCKRKYSKEEYEFMECPECGEDRRCRHHPVDGELGRACHFHGGRTPRGVNSPHYEGKGYSKDMPTRLAESYTRWLKDEDRLSVDYELAVARALLQSYVKEMNEDGSLPLWGVAIKTYADFKGAQTSSDPKERVKAAGYLLELERILSEGADAESIESKVFSRMRTIDRLSRTQAALDETKGKLISLDKVFTLLALIFETIRRDTASLDEGRQILTNLQRVLTEALGPMDRESIGALTDPRRSAEAVQSEG